VQLAELEKTVNGFATNAETNTGIFNSLKLYPNPNNGTINIEYESPDLEQRVFEIYDMANKKVFESILKGGEKNYTITNTNLPNGIYYYQVLSKEKLIAKNKLVIIN